jgi:hypothetical protein
MKKKTLTNVINEIIKPLNITFAIDDGNKTFTNAIDEIIKPLNITSAIDDENKTLTNAIDENIKTLKITPAIDDNWFISQSSEGIYEGLSTKNIIKAIDPKYDILFNFGIGKGSSQFTLGINTIPYGFGMNKSNILVNGNILVKDEQSLAKTVSLYFSKLDYIKQIIDTAQDMLNPVIALKSGCLIFFEDTSDLMKSMIIHGPLHADGGYYLQQFKKESKQHFINNPYKNIFSNSIYNSKLVGGKLIKIYKN